MFLEILVEANIPEIEDDFHRLKNRNLSGVINYRPKS